MKMKKRILFLFSLLALLPHTLIAAAVSFESTNRQIALLELYTSEGCSSCPPADRWLSSLEKADGLWQSFIPIALHVDYWDYIGWKDRFASPLYSARQRQYAREQSLKTVYTPGFTYNGQEWRNWFVKRMFDFPKGNMPGILKLEINDNQASVNFVPTNTLLKKLNVNLALLGFDLETKVKAGENKGKKLPHNFVVLAINQADLVKENDHYISRLEVPNSKIKTSRYGIVAWINDPNKQKPLQTVGGWLPAY
jgi:hypothetical protein